MISVLKRGRKTRALSVSLPLPSENKEEAVICKPERRFSPGTESAGTLIFDFHLLEL